MITVTGRLAAAIVMIAAGAFIAAVGIVIAVQNRATGHEVLAGLIAVSVAVIAGLWLRRDGKRRRKS